MRRTLALLACAAAVLPFGQAQAQGRPATPALSCAAAAGLVARSGSIVLTTGPFTYDRFVRDGGFCPLPEIPRPAFEVTLDDPKCFVGYICKDKFTENNGRD